ncbi:hypothetical protein BD311DRAFT_755130 [Dichomitus squalens]|uniref:Uncharacterized protein n=1 Tax=Dichomitus squalens TaxID=114155 RepID=A0A4Q9MVG3_9APHY|nr:hypothetical protein BD311DRAFT_755130 [Dichomitus squalens]
MPARRNPSLIQAGACVRIHLSSHHTHRPMPINRGRNTAPASRPRTRRERSDESLFPYGYSLRTSAHRTAIGNRTPRSVRLVLWEHAAVAQRRKLWGEKVCHLSPTSASTMRCPGRPRGARKCANRQKISATACEGRE